MKKETIHSVASNYGSYTIVDGIYNDRPARVLFGSHETPQSGVAHDDEPELLFNYNQRFFEIIMNLSPNRILIIGGGAGTLPTALFHRFQNVHIDVVEIDPLLVELAYTYFDLPKSPRLHVHVADGKSFVETASAKYDVIILDAFSGFTIPHHLLEKDTIELYKKCLTRNGTVALNFISSYKASRNSLAHEIIASFAEAFSNRSLYQADAEYPRGEEQNYILAASDTPLHFDYLQSDEQDLLL